MQEALQFLIELQEIENRIQALLVKKDLTPKRLAALKEEMVSAEAGLERQKEMLDAVRRSRRQLEQEVEDLEGRAGRSEQQLLKIKSNKEYQARLKEIDDVRELVRGREDDIIEKMEQAEQLQQRLNEQKRLVRDARQRMEQEGTQLEREAEEADELIKGLEKQQDQLNPKIPADLLKRYKFLKAKRGGVAVAPVKKGTCQICHMNLPPQMFIDLQRDEQLLNCPNCQRIVYWVGHEAYKNSSEILQDRE